MRALLIISMIFAVTSLPARAGVTYTITSYPGGLADLPSDAFEKNADGSWTQVAILVGGAPLFRPAIVSKTLPRRASSSGSATPVGARGDVWEPSFRWDRQGGGYERRRRVDLLQTLLVAAPAKKK
jgi:hypothetical protein